ncbi:YihY/virulence factor BrkB family protein [Fructobacillus sp. M1-13]|uniref:YihY/virulence factor BrkB family protein n=1 Tax=Fructobacillus papyriferae TaxID=2713171 RepID=A0ABS5QSZ5_9LACO|nr:YhjD/YihY/BrkB family envelope integrity protein [Fructobacillus papyriferae]MBS9335082.1 YihY/virulence factor BrkB family protein [Fructobacillus papyriferae]MCD2159432.1 YihY/virulence factor BrkB family protein [Fructobacillus papyriferae]
MTNSIKKMWAFLDKKLHLNDLVTYFSRSQINMVGPTFAYYVLLTLFPLLIAVALLISAVHMSTGRLTTMMADFLPSSVNDFLGPVLTSVAHSNTQSYWSISLVFIFWSLSRVITVLREAFNRIADVEEPFLPILARFWSFLWLLLMVVAFTVLVFSGNILGVYLSEITGMGIWVTPTRFLLLIGLWLVLLWMNYQLPAKAARPPFLASLAGSLLDLLLLNGLNKIFALLANLQFGKYSFYESLTSIIVFLLWLNLVAMVLVFGFVVMNWLSGFRQLRGERHVSEK